MEEFISRMGRSLFTIIMYNGHSVTDLPTEGIKNSITYKFVFRCRNNKEEAGGPLEYLGGKITENMGIIQNLHSGSACSKICIIVWAYFNLMQFSRYYRRIFNNSEGR